MVASVQRGQALWRQLMISDELKSEIRRLFYFLSPVTLIEPLFIAPWKLSRRLVCSLPSLLKTGFFRARGVDGHAKDPGRKSLSANPGCRRPILVRYKL